MKNVLRCLVLVLVFAFSAAARAAPASGYWWNQAEGGRGFVIEVQGSQMFMAGFLYAASGEATWVASFGAMASGTQYSGPLVTFSGGQTLTGAYQAPAQNPQPAGTISISFSDASHGTLTWPGGTIPIQRLDFGAGGAAAAEPATNPENGWWFNPAEGGRGFAVEVQNGSMYLAGYMYDGAGNPLWYLASGAMGNPVTFQGTWTQFGNGQTLTGKYKAPVTVNGNVGAATLQFNSAYGATLTLPNGRQVPLIRYGFGVTPPVLSAFSPGAAAPESLLTISGSGFDALGTVTLTLADASGYSVNIPAASVSASAIKVSVPPYIAAASGAFGTGTVSLQAVQKSNGVSVVSNTLAGFAIQALPAVAGAPGQSTLSLIRANLAEAQKLQASVAGTPQGTPAVTAALAQQVANLQALVNNIQSVVQQGLSFSLGAINGVNITVTPANIADVDSLILATLQSLANPPAGSLRGAQASSPACLAAEAAAFAAAMSSGSGNLQQLAQNLMEAPQTSAACNTASAFGSAYQIFGGAGEVGLGIANGAGGGVVGARLPGTALFAAAAQNASSAVGINALTSPALASQVAAVQGVIAGVAAQANPTTNVLLAKSTGALAANIAGAQNVTTAGSTGSGIQKAKALVNALNADAALVTGANSPPQVLSSFQAQLNAIMQAIHDISNGHASPETVAFSGGSARVTGVTAGSITNYTAVVTPTAGGSYTSTWVVNEVVSGTVTTESGTVSGTLMPVSTGAAPTSISGNVAATLNSATGSTSTITLTSLQLSTADNGAGKPESLALSNVTINTVADVNGNVASGNLTGTLIVSIGAASYDVALTVAAAGKPLTSGSIDMTYSGPNGSFKFTDRATVSGNLETQALTLSQGTINISATLGPYNKNGSPGSLPTSLTVYDGTTQIGSFSGKTVSFVDGSFITFSF